MLREMKETMATKSELQATKSELQEIKYMLRLGLVAFKFFARNSGFVFPNTH